jgi:glycosyltransferase involved in cell wall biosynthesis
MIRSANPERLRVAITSNTLNAGGAEMQRVLLANEMVSLGHAVTLYCLQSQGPLRSLVDDGVQVATRPSWLGARRGYDVLLTGTTNTESLFGLVSRCIPNRSSVWTVAIHNPMGPDAPNLKWLSRFSLFIADNVVALSEWHSNQVQRSWHIKPDSVISNGIDLSWAAKARNARDSARFEFDVGFIGRLSKKHKGLDLLLQAMAQPGSEKVQLAIAGTGPDEIELREKARNLKIDDRISWLGHQNAQEFLTKVRVLALFSRYEGQPMVLLEAHAADVPVIGSMFSGAVPSGNDIVVDAFNAQVAGRALANSSSTLYEKRQAADLPNSVTTMALEYAAVFRRSIGRSPRLPRWHSERKA